MSPKQYKYSAKKSKHSTKPQGSWIVGQSSVFLFIKNMTCHPAIFL